MPMRPRNKQSTAAVTQPLQRIRWWYAFLLLLCGVFIIRLFYIQVIKHDYYQKAAFKSQLKQYELPAERGVISAYNGNKLVPLVLNETLFTLYADPTYIVNAKSDAGKIQSVIGGTADDYTKKLETKDTRYVVLAKKLSREQAGRIDGLKLKGIGTRDTPYRTYPDGQLASQLLGFVNDDGAGTYGLEQALNKGLSGTPGRLKAITDAAGVPLPANKDNLVQEPKSGMQVVLTIDIGLQQQLEDILKTGVENAKGKSGSALILDINNGAVKAMANYPTYNPSEYSKVDDSDVFNNAAVSAPLEVGSIMKALTASAALDLGVVAPTTTYYDPRFFNVDGATVRNVEEDGGAGTKSVTDILQLSLNTGATWMLMQMGGGEINSKARTTWHTYMTDHFRLGQATGIEQGYEAEGFIPSPTEGFGLNITYANTAFGQGMTATPLQMAAAFGSVLNGGTYYRPHLLDKEISSAGTETVKKPEIVGKDVVSPAVSKQVKEMLELTFKKNHRVYSSLPHRAEFSMGGKTGTAQISKQEGGYYDDRYNGTYMGFVGGDTPQYVIVVRVSEPRIAGYAGAKAAAPIYVSLANMLIDNYGVEPKRQ